MSRAFVKEDNDPPEEPVKRQPSGRPNYVTPAGLDALKARLAQLAALREKLLAGKQADEARSLRLSQVEMDLAYYEGQVKSARVVDNRGRAGDEVRFGASVTVRDRAGAEKEYSIVGEDEANAASGKLNWASPLAAALLGKKTGASVVLRIKGGELDMEITRVRYQ